MSDDRPDILGYQSAAREKRSTNRPAYWQVVIGVLAGGALSGATWPFIWRHDSWFVPIGCMIVAIKTFGAGIIATFKPRARQFAVGLLLSIALDVLIIFVTCALATGYPDTELD